MMYLMLIVIISAAAASGVIFQGFTSTIRGVLAIWQHPARLINDFTVVGGSGGALVNAAIMAGLTLLIIRLNDVQLSGPTIAAVFTVFGFGLFGKTPLNSIPIIIGTAISARIAGHKFKEYILIALFGTALGPLVSFIVFEMGFSGPVPVFGGVFAGILAGMLLPSVAIAMLHLHQGYNLYNMGLTCGFVGLFAASMISAAKGNIAITVIWNTEADLLLTLFIPVLSLALILFGFLLKGKGLWEDLLAIQKLPGRLPSDFIDMVSAGGAFLNTGLLGLVAWLYVIVVGGDLNGPVLGGILTVMGFGVFGKHLKNSIPIVIGVVFSCLLFDKSLSAPGPLLAALFATTLAPIAGEFGAFTGIIAGFIHLVMVERTGAWHGGIDLYNNGFAGGLTAALIISVIEWYRNSRPDDFEDKF
jgi:hypothetical protein